MEMPVEAEVLLQLMRSALVYPSRQILFPDGCEEEKLVYLINRHRILSTVYPVIRNQEGEQWKNIKEKLKTAYGRAVRRNIVQEQEIQDLLDGMEDEGIECIPLKGWILRNCYPDSTLRSMADFDVLVKDYDCVRMTKWMDERGYTPGHLDEGFHDNFLKKPYMNIEIHRMLIKDNKSQQVWEKGLWSRCTPEEGKRSVWRMSAEDFYIYHLIHMDRHFTQGGIGLRSLADTWLYLQHYQAQMDQKYLNQMLKKLGLSVFAQCMEKLSRICMEGEKTDEESRMLLKYMMDSGAYGTVKHVNTIEVMNQKKSDFLTDKLSVKLHVIFPEMEVVRCRYPIVGRYPVLLPFFWIIRIIRVIFCDRAKLNALDYSAVSKEQYHLVQDVFRIAGIRRRDT